MFKHVHSEAFSFTDHSSIAGGETVSTFLAGATYFLLQHPQKLKTLVTEIREAFKSYADINAKDAQQLTYLQAVINEGLRLYPPASQGSPRISSGFELHGRYIPQGVSCFATLHNHEKLMIVSGRDQCQPVDCGAQSRILG